MPSLSNSMQKSLKDKEHSWILINNNIAVKEMDKSSFLHHGTGIPIDIRSFFSCDGMSSGERIQVSINYSNEKFNSTLEMDKQKNPRTRLLWKADLSNKIKEHFPSHFESFVNGREEIQEPLIMRFERTSDDQTFNVTIYSAVNENVLANDIESDLIENGEPRKEGAIKQYYGKRYERDTTNRKKAIQLHGLNCIVCNFDFEKIYGERGKDFIEVHHIKPLFTLEGQLVDINPATDLVPVCANCHKMIHRRHDEVLTIEQMKAIVKVKFEYM